MEGLSSLLRWFPPDDTGANALGYHTYKVVYNLRGAEAVLLSEFPEATCRW